jgi:hypothetical protein
MRVTEVSVMRSAVVLVSMLVFVGTCACGESQKPKRRVATLARLAKTDCVAIAAKATRCDSAVRRAADKAQSQTGKKHLSMMLTLGLTAFKSVSRCRKYVQQRVTFMRRSCQKYGKSEAFCRTAQSKYLRGLNALNKCFAFDGCEQIAACYVKHHADTAI